MREIAMPVCLKCGWEIVIGPGGCACTQAARHKRAMEKAAKAGEDLSKRLEDMGLTKSKEWKKFEETIDAMLAHPPISRKDMSRIAADFRALQRRRKHPKRKK